MGYYCVINPITLSNFSVGHRSLIAALYKVYLMVITICIRSTQAHSAHGSENCRNIWGQEIHEITGIRNLVGELCPEKRLTPGRIRERNQVQAVILMYTAISTTVGVKREPLMRVLHTVQLNRAVETGPPLSVSRYKTCQLRLISITSKALRLHARSL